MNNRYHIRLVPLVLLLLIQWSVIAQQIIVRPYMQPGNASGFGKEERVLIWQTVGVPADFKVSYTGGRSFDNQKKIREAKVTSELFNLGGVISRIYRATLNKLVLDSAFVYDVSLNGKSIASDWFYTRTTKNKTRFALVGDSGEGSKEQAAIAFQIYQAQPDFTMIIGDIVYEMGLAREYLKNFFPYYMAQEASPERGAPLLGKIPFYSVIGNHDVLSDDLDKYPDGLAYFHYMDLPMNAPQGQFYLKPKGSDEALKNFKSITRPRYPSMTNYSFDYGNVHILVLDSNPYTSPLDSQLLPWFINDIRTSKADWKIVSFHHPGFNSNAAHNDDQLMRLLSPIMEELNVDLVLSGHVHNYQRTVPLLFDPKKDDAGKQYVISPEGRVEGTFTLDNAFDGVSKTKPKGIIYIVTGAGGAPLYDDKLTNYPDKWLNGPSAANPFTIKMVSDLHSFTLIETNGKTLILKQIDKEGNVFDEIKVTK